MFSTGIIEKIGYYVYCLVDPRDGNIFYVGKGVGNRVFQHVEGALDGKIKSDKNDLINAINQVGHQPDYYILRHNIENEAEAFEYEALAIDLLSLVKDKQQPLTNIQDGVRSSEKGLMSLSELKQQYDPEELKTDLPLVLININREYDKLKKAIAKREIAENERENEIYERTRRAWRIGKRREKAQYAVAVYRGWTLAVYEIEKWYPSEIHKGRWEFIGKALPATSTIYQELVDKLTYSSDEDYRAPQNPITYWNC